LGLTNVTIAGQDYVGSLIGYRSATTVSKVFTTGTVSGRNYVGGLMGWAEDGTISNSYTKANVSGSSTVAGFIGINNFSTVSNSYSVGTVSGASTLGGFLGQNTGTITNCYWDASTSGQITSGGGIGLTTAEMKSLCSYAATWIFPTNWTLNSTFNDGYPALAWQVSTHTASCPTIWSGTAWSNGTPTASLDAIINGNYNEAVGFQAKNLTINSGFSLNIPSMQSVTVNGDLVNNGTIWLKSNIATTDATGALITKAALTNNGTMKAEKFLTLPYPTGQDNWHLVGSPLVANVAVESIFLNDYVYRYNATPDWETLVAGVSQITSQEGYLAQTVATDGKNLLFSGTFNTGDATFTLTPTADLWNLISNPFPSPIDLEQLSIVNATTYFYVWDLLGKNYKFYIKGDAAHSTASSPYVQSMQGFFAGLIGATKSAAPATGTVTIPNTARVANSVFNVTKSKKLSSNNLHFSVFAADQANDHAVIRFAENNLEIKKFFSMIADAPQTYVINENKNLSLISYSDPAAERIVPVAFESSANGEYVFKIENFGLTTKVLLFDRLLNIFTELNSETAYTFSHLATNDKHRFDLYFNPKTTGVEQVEKQIAKVYANDKTIFICLEKAEATTISVFDLSGRKLNELKSNQQNNEINGLQQGVYILKLVNSSGWQTTKVFVE